MLVLHPGPPVETTVEEAYAAPLGAHPDRPWVGLSMVTSIDGSIAVAGLSGGLSSPVDQSVMLRLRALAQVVLVGAGTAAGEGYGPPARGDHRIGVVTRSGRVDLSTDLFRSGAGFVVTTEDTRVGDDDTSAEDVGVDVVRAGVGEVDLALAMSRLSAVAGDVDFVQVEGGARLNGAVADADLFDEMSITTSPALVAGEGPRLAVGGAETVRRFDPAQVAVDDAGFVFTRWRRVRDA